MTHVRHSLYKSISRAAAAAQVRLSNRHHREARLVAALAQADATLAVAEQLRIGNLIALAKLAGREEDVHEELAQVAYQALDQFIDWKMTSDDDAVTFLAPDIARALGIDRRETGYEPATTS